MLTKYYVSKKAQDNGDREVHREGCGYLPGQEDRIYLGEFRDCRTAVWEAKKYYAQVNGCFYCLRECHTQ